MYATGRQSQALPSPSRLGVGQQRPHRTKQGAYDKELPQSFPQRRHLSTCRRHNPIAQRAQHAAHTKAADKGSSIVSGYHPRFVGIDCYSSVPKKDAMHPQILALVMFRFDCSKRLRLHGKP